MFNFLSKTKQNSSICRCGRSPLTWTSDCIHAESIMLFIGRFHLCHNVRYCDISLRASLNSLEHSWIEPLFNSTYERKKQKKKVWHIRPNFSEWLYTYQPRFCQYLWGIIHLSHRENVYFHPCCTGWLPNRLLYLHVSQPSYWEKWTKFQVKIIDIFSTSFLYYFSYKKRFHSKAKAILQKTKTRSNST